MCPASPAIALGKPLLKAPRPISSNLTNRQAITFKEIGKGRINKLQSIFWKVRQLQVCSGGSRSPVRIGPRRLLAGATPRSAIMQDQVKPGCHFLLEL
jgi:hypothetical protein